MRRIKLVLAVAAAMVVLMVVAVPAMADINFGGSNGHSINHGGGFTILFSGNDSDINDGFDDASDFVGLFDNNVGDITVDGGDFTFE
jgi:hypothetical protein